MFLLPWVTEEALCSLRDETIPQTPPDYFDGVDEQHLCSCVSTQLLSPALSVFDGWIPLAMCRVYCAPAQYRPCTCYVPAFPFWEQGFKGGLPKCGRHNPCA